MGYTLHSALQTFSRSIMNVEALA